MVGLLNIASVASVVSRQRNEVLTKRQLDERQNEPVLLGIAAYLRVCWDAAVAAKRPIEKVMLKALRQRNGTYEPDKLQAIKLHGGSGVFMMLTEVKCRGAESWLRDILMDDGTPPWALSPTPKPDLPDDQEKLITDIVAQYVTDAIQALGKAPTPEEMAQLKETAAQELRFARLKDAQERADRMQTKIEDQFIQGGWPESFNEFITDLTTFPAAFVKGPIVRRQRKLEWTQDQAGKTVAQTTEVLAPEYDRADPFMIYPEPGVTNINDGYLFEHHPMPRHELAALIGVPGYDSAAIREILDTGPGSSWVTQADKTEKDAEERKFSVDQRPTDIFDALQFWGKISGKMLIEWGLSEKEVPDPQREYDAEVWLVGNYVIKALLNYDPLGEKPYAKTSFIRTPGAFWGKGIPEIIEDLQNVCNAAVRALVNNLGIASGPQVEVNTERVPVGEDISEVYPWKIWQVLNDPLGSSAPAVRFNQPNDNSAQLIGVYDKFSKLADDHSGVPSYIYGDLNVQGAGRTASGLSMLMGSAGKGIRQVVMHIDSDIIKPVVQRQFVYNMRYVEDESIKGDVQIVPKGAINLAVKDTVNVRRVEFLNATANQYDMEIIGKSGRAAVLREVAKGLQMPAEEVVPSQDKQDLTVELKAAQPQQAQPQQAQPPKPLSAGGLSPGGRQGNTVTPRGPQGG